MLASNLAPNQQMSHSLYKATIENDHLHATKHLWLVQTTQTNKCCTKCLDILSSILTCSESHDKYWNTLNFPKKMILTTTWRYLSWCNASSKKTSL